MEVETNSKRQLNVSNRETTNAVLDEVVEGSLGEPLQHLLIC